MKKCSHSKHETMTELNITPLLDLAFVLLVIFIITTTPIVNDLDLNLPKSSKHAKDPPRKATYITVNAGGAIWVNKREVADVASLAAMLGNMRLDDPDLSVIVRGDGTTKYREIRAVLDACQSENVVKVDLQTDAADKK